MRSSLTAEDAAFTYETCRGAGSMVDLTIVDKIEVIDDYTVAFTLTNPASTFLYQTAGIGIVPAHAYGENYNENPIVTGPYKMVQWDKGQQVILEQNEYYYGEKSEIQKIVTLFMDLDTAFAAAQAGQVDVVLTDPGRATHEIEGYEMVQCKAVDNLGISFPMVPEGSVNNEGEPIGNDVTSDEAIRKACCYGIDRNSIRRDVIGGFGSPAYSMCGNMGRFNTDTVLADDEVGKQILEDAGRIGEDGDGVREKDGLRASFNIVYPADETVRQTIAFAEQCKPPGIEVTTEGMSWDEVFLNRSSNCFVLALGEFSTNELYQCSSGLTRGVGYSNFYFYGNETVDEYMAQALAATTEAEANELWKKAQRDGETGSNMLGDAPICRLVNVDRLFYVRDGLDIGTQRMHSHGGDGYQFLDNIAERHRVTE